MFEPNPAPKGASLNGTLRQLSPKWDEEQHEQEKERVDQDAVVLEEEVAVEQEVLSRGGQSAVTTTSKNSVKKVAFEVDISDCKGPAPAPEDKRDEAGMKPYILYARI